MKYNLTKRKNVAIYGGAFDCIHNGHIESAKFILNALHFDFIFLMPAFSHMYNKKMTDSKHRIKMCELASKVDNRIKVFDYEIKHELGGETYRLVKMLINDIEFDNFDFSFVMGIDNANTFHKWVNYEHLEKMMKFVIIPRKGYKADENVKWFLSKPHIFMNDEINNVPEISSTEIKKMIKNGLNKELEKYLNPDVIKYIKDNNLYES